MNALGAPQSDPLAFALGSGVGQLFVVSTVFAVEVNRLLVAVSSGGDWKVRWSVVELWRFLG